MNPFNRTKFVSILFLSLLPAFLVVGWSMWSFRTGGYLGRIEPILINEYKQNYGVDVYEHGGQEGIITAGVHPLGKVGAIIMFLWSLFLIVVLGSYYETKTDDEIKEINKIMGGLNIGIVGLIMILSGLTNIHLLWRTLPFLFIQMGISIVILNDSTA